MTSPLSYTRVDSKRRSLSLQILPDGSIVVKAPERLSEKVIEKFIEEHDEWIKSKLSVVSQRPHLKHTYTEGDIFLYLGQEVTLTIGDFAKIEVKNKKLYFPMSLTFRIKKEIEDFYVREARRLITFQTEKYAREMKTSFTDITFSDTRSQWGRCTADNRLQFSWRLIMSPLLTLNYVIIHELAHTTEKNHSRAFWSTVRRFTPSYRQQVKWLKENSGRMSI